MQRPRAGRRRGASTSSATRRSASSTCSAAVRRGGRRRRRLRGQRARRASGTRRSCSPFEREMLGLYVSDHPLFGVEHVLAAAADCIDRARCTADEAADGRDRHGGRHPVRGAAQGDQAGRRRGRIATLEDLEGVDRGDVLPADLPRSRRSSSRTRSSRSRAGSTGATTRPKLIAMELTVPDLSEGPRGPVVVTHARRPGARRRWSSGSRRCSRTHPGTTEVHLQLHGGAARTCCGSRTACGSRPRRR